MTDRRKLNRPVDLVGLAYWKHRLTAAFVLYSKASTQSTRADEPLGGGVEFLLIYLLSEATPNPL